MLIIIVITGSVVILNVGGWYREHSSWRKLMGRREPQQQTEQTQQARQGMEAEAEAKAAALQDHDRWRPRR